MWIGADVTTVDVQNLCRTGERTIGRPQFLTTGHRVRGKVQLTTKVGEFHGVAATWATQDISNQHGPIRRPVGLPEFAAVNTVIRGEVQDPIDVGQRLRLRSSQARKNVANKYRSVCGTVGFPKLNATRRRVRSKKCRGSDLSETGGSAAFGIRSGEDIPNQLVLSCQQNPGFKHFWSGAARQTSSFRAGTGQQSEKSSEQLFHRFHVQQWSHFPT